MLWPWPWEKVSSIFIDWLKMTKDMLWRDFPNSHDPGHESQDEDYLLTKMKIMTKMAKITKMTMPMKMTRLPLPWPWPWDMVSSSSSSTINFFRSQLRIFTRLHTESFVKHIASTFSLYLGAPLQVLWGNCDVQTDTYSSFLCNLNRL